MAQTTISVRVDQKDKDKLEDFCNSTGMNVSVAINMFIKTVIREHRLPFDVTTDPFYSEANQKRVSDAIADLNNGKGKPHELIGGDND